MLSINGADTSTTPRSVPSATGSGASPRATDRREAKQVEFAQAFSSIVAVLMRDANYRHLKIAALEHLVVPAVLSGQWRIAHAPAPSAVTLSKHEMNKIPMVPVGTALWASVSDEVDRKLTESLDKRLVLSAGEWCSGSNLWLIAIAGSKAALPKFMQQLRDGEFKGKRVKMCARDGKGKPFIASLDEIVA